MGEFARVTAFLPDGTVMLEDGREMQAVMSRSGSIGVRPKETSDHVAMLDQTGPIPTNYFDTSGLDQG